jgi:hypothetical protein
MFNKELVAIGTIYAPKKSKVAVITAALSKLHCIIKPTAKSVKAQHSQIELADETQARLREFAQAMREVERIAGTLPDSLVDGLLIKELRLYANDCEKMACNCQYTHNDGGCAHVE